MPYIEYLKGSIETVFYQYDCLLYLKIWMNAPMEHTTAAHMLIARTPWALTVAFVKKVTQEMASLVQVSLK